MEAYEAWVQNCYDKKHCSCELGVDITKCRKCSRLFGGTDRVWQAAMEQVLKWMNSGECHPEDVDYIIERELGK